MSCFIQRPFLRLTLLLVLFGSMAALLYANTLNVPFIFDDWRQIESNRHVRIESLRLDSLAGAAFESPHPTRPVANTSFALNYYFHGYAVGGYHIANIAVHIFTGVFLCLLFMDTLCLSNPQTDRESACALSFLAALLWFCHPLQTQSVTYIVQRMTSMAAMFYVLALLCYVRARTAEKAGLAWSWFSVCMLSVLLAMGSKETAVTLPFFIVLYEWFFLQDLKADWHRRVCKPLLLLVFFVAAVVLVYTDGQPLRAVLAGYQIRDFTLVQRLLTELRVLVFYMSLLLFPHPARLNFDHDFSLSTSLVSPPSTLSALLFLAGLFMLACSLARKERLLSFAVFWFLGNLVVESTVVGLELVFEHRLYQPSMFVFLSFVLILRRIINNRKIVVGLLGLLVLICSVWTYQRNSVWRDEISLWDDSVRKSPNKPRTHSVLANAFERAGNYEMAGKHYAAALQLSPRNADKIRFNLGNSYLQQNRYSDAAREFSELLLLYPETRRAHNNLGVALMRQGRLAEAAYHFVEELRINPGFDPAVANLELLRHTFSGAGKQ